jgi:hypothetical protein
METIRDEQRKEVEKEVQFIQSRITELSERLGQIERLIAQHAQEREEVRGTLENYRGVERDLLKRLGKVPPVEPSTDAQDFAHLSINEAAYRVLKERQPLSTQQITKELLGRGKTFDRDDPSASVGAILRMNKGRFRPEKRGNEVFWSLVEETTGPSMN